MAALLGFRMAGREDAPSAVVLETLRYHLLYVGAARLARTMDLEEVFKALESALHFQVAIAARHKLFIRAGVVGWQGRASVRSWLPVAKSLVGAAWAPCTKPFRPRKLVG
jgi:hypothetical protein